jgi:hypothetical protein
MPGALRLAASVEFWTLSIAVNRVTKGPAAVSAFV